MRMRILVELTPPSWDRDTNESSWTLETKQSSISSSSPSSGVGEWEGAPKNWCGGSCPVAPLESVKDPEGFLRMMHHNLHHLVEDELTKIDGTAEEQAWCLPILSELLVKKVSIEEELHMRDEEKERSEQQAISHEFLVTRTISNAEVWKDLDAWGPSIKQEYNQLVHEKGAVRQLTMKQLQQLSQERGVPIELLPGKTVHTRKSQTGAYRSRAVICGNYASATDQEVYAGGSDSIQVRTALKVSAIFDWKVVGTDVKTAFLNARRRDDTKLVAMTIPSVFKRLGLATDEDVWLVEMALYGLTTSPRDWGIHRDCTLGHLTWSRAAADGGGEIRGHFERTKDDNLWRLVEKDANGIRWCGLLCVYVDDLLFCGEEEPLQHALAAVESQWSCAEAEWASDVKPLKFCGIEITVDKEGNGLHLSQRGYETELLDRWPVQEGLNFPNYKINEQDFEAADQIDPKVLREAQALAGALLWLSTKTRPDISFGVSAMSRLMSRNPQKALEVGKALLSYIKSNPGDLHYCKHFANDGWGERSQLKSQRNHYSIEVFSDIAYAAGTGHRSIQGIAVFFAGSPVAWQSSQQPFTTHSTAESELVSYCESLLIGRATEALLCAVFGVPLDKNNPFSRTIYGDNMAAIGLASGNTCASWRTRHLRIRAAILKEAMDEMCEVPGGVWRLLHLKGSELVADGLTKHLLGQAFARFVEDLGLKRMNLETPSQSMPSSSSTTNGGDGGAAMMVLGSMLLSTAEASKKVNKTEEDQVDDDFSLIWTAGLILMTLGAIYTAQMLQCATKFCIRKLRTSVEDRESVVVSEGEDEVTTSRTREIRSATRRRSGSCNATGGMSRRRDQNVAAGSSSSASSGLTPGQGPSSSSLSVLTPVQGPSLKSLQHDLTPGQGPLASQRDLTPGQGLSKSQLMLTPEQGPCASTASSTSLKSLRQSGQHSYEPAAVRAASAAADLAESLAAVAGEAAAAAERPSGERPDHEIQNPWNLFQRQNRHKGWSSAMMAEQYHSQRKRTKP